MFRLVWIYVRARSFFSYLVEVMYENLNETSRRIVEVVFL